MKKETAECSVCKNQSTIDNSITLKQLLIGLASSSAGVLFVLNLIIDNRMSISMKEVIKEISALKRELVVWKETAPLKFAKKEDVVMKDQINKQYLNKTAKHDDK